MAHIRETKTFIPNLPRFNDVIKAKQLAEEIWYDCEVTVDHDPWQTGELVLTIKGCFIQLQYRRELNALKKIIDKANYFELFPKGNEFELSIGFRNALKRIQ